jgi:uncharacterized protein CbrC (UPF0167 family)
MVSCLYITYMLPAKSVVVCVKCASKYSTSYCKKVFHKLRVESKLCPQCVTKEMQPYREQAIAFIERLKNIKDQLPVEEDNA